MHCTKCDKQIDGKDAGAHSRWCGHSKNLDMFCKVCGKTFKDRDRRKTLCSVSCRNVNRSNIFKDERLRKRISDSRKAWLAANPEKHPWKRSSKFESEPCQKLKDALQARSIDFHEEFTPLEDRFFSLDVAFPALKVGIEVNGEQHYNRNGSLKLYYQQRHDLIESAGWKLYEVHYSICYSQKRLENIIDNLIRDLDLENADLIFAIKKKEKLVPKYGSWKAAGAAQRQRTHEKYENERGLWQSAIDSIDTTKYGWIQKLSKKMNCSHTHTRRILNKYFSEVQTFKRRTNNSAL
jgi:very-short-patch-repair endonuclease